MNVGSRHKHDTNTISSLYFQIYEISFQAGCVHLCRVRVPGSSPKPGSVQPTSQRFNQLSSLNLKGTKECMCKCQNSEWLYGYMTMSFRTGLPPHAQDQLPDMSCGFVWDLFAWKLPQAEVSIIHTMHSLKYWHFIQMDI